jgi:putative addiction module antidote
LRALTGSYNFSYKWDMELKVRKIGNGYGVLFPKQLMEDMRVEEGSLLEVNKVEGGHLLKPVDEEFSRQVEAFLRTEQKHRNTYRELAK